MVVFDATMLLPLLWPDVPTPKDPDTGRPVDRFRERVDHLIDQLEKSRTKIIVPTPALSEILVRAGAAGPEYLEKINSFSVFRPVAFDERAAVEVAAMTKLDKDAGDKKGGQDGVWSKIKYDRQIIAIAKVEGATAIYSDDKGIRGFAQKAGITVIRLKDLPLPPEDSQRSLDLESVLPDADEKTSDEEAD